MRIALTIAATAGLALASGAAPAQAEQCSPPAGGYQVAIERFVPFKNRFGETIAVDLYLPADAAGAPLTKRGCRFPVVLESSPYRDWITPEPTKTSDDQRRSWWVQRGYVYAFADVPGVGGSDGRWCFMCRHEQLSGYDIVEALGREPWSTGRVGMIGGSYPGITALLVAQLRPTHLQAVIAANFFRDPYHDFFYVGGLPRFEDATALMAAYTALSRWTGQYELPASPAELQRALQVFEERASSPPPDFLEIQSRHPTYDGYWSERAVHPERIRVPTLLVGGWNDMFDRPEWEVYDRLGAQVKFLLQGPFTHVPVYMPPGAWPCASQDADFCGAPLFDHVLKGEDSAGWQTFRENRVRTYVEPYGAAQGAAYLSRPAKPVTRRWTLRLGEAGQAAMLRYNPASGLTSGQWFLRGSVPGSYPPFDSLVGADGPADQRLEQQTALSLSTGALARDVTLVGEGVLRLRVIPQSDDGDVVVRLVDEAPPGSSPFAAGYGTLVTNGWLRASHRLGDSATSIRPLTPGHPVTLTIPVWPVGYRFAKGDAIRLDIYSSDVPRFRPPTRPSSMRIDLSRSQLTLPSLDPAPPARFSLQGLTGGSLGVP